MSYVKTLNTEYFTERLKQTSSQPDKIDYLNKMYELIKINSMQNNVSSEMEHQILLILKNINDFDSKIQTIEKINYAELIIEKMKELIMASRRDPSQLTLELNLKIAERRQREMQEQSNDTYVTGTITDVDMSSGYSTICSILIDSPFNRIINQVLMNGELSVIKKGARISFYLSRSIISIPGMGSNVIYSASKKSEATARREDLADFDKQIADIRKQIVNNKSAKQELIKIFNSN